LWWGSLTTLGFLVVPLLFMHLATPAMAGNMAAKLFAVQTWISLVCGGLLMIFLPSKASAKQLGYARAALIFVAIGMLLAALNEFAVSPQIVARENLKLWHGIGSAMYLIQWVCSAVVLWKLAATPAPSQLA
jgi:Na+/melibiose symporter-like transporter